ncbi:Uncharacterised protein [Salmonella enterica subsp. enterica]|nr:Uncharacterised protein [Salmonella enterica subsp. enterica]
MNKYYIHSFFTITIFVNLIHHAILLMMNEKCTNKYR